MSQDHDRLGPSPQSAANALELAEIRATLAAADRQSAIWRGLGTLAATCALSLAGWALSLAQTAAVDHARVDRLEHTERAISDRMERLIEAQTRTQAQLEQMTTTLAEVRTDVRELRDEHAREIRR